MDDKKLRSFVEIAQSGSLTSASEKLYLSPTALMRHMDSLEKELNSVLLNRSPSGCTLTQAGAYFLERAIIILNEIDQTTKTLHEMNHHQNELTICYGEDYAMTSIDQFCAAYNINHPSVHFKCVPLPPSKWVSSVVNKQTDCAFLVKDFWLDDIGDLNYTHIYSSQIYCVMSATHPLAKKNKILMNDLKDHVLVTDQTLMLNFCRDAEQVGATISNISSPSAPVIFNACQRHNVYITIDLMIPQYYPLICVPLDYPSLSCGFITRKKTSFLLKDFIESSKTIQLRLLGI